MIISKHMQVFVQESRFGAPGRRLPESFEVCDS